MIAKIMPPSKNFAAVEYNEKKVKEGKALLLSQTHFPNFASDLLVRDAQVLKNCLQAWSSVNTRCENAQFHAVISCKGREYSDEQLLQIANQYLSKMGYAGLPTLIYAHHDTDNNHLHIVTTRIQRDGRKVPHDHERRRSQAVINEIMGVNRKQETMKAIYDALNYKYADINQFNAILESMGYESFREKEQMLYKKDGTVQLRVNTSDILSHVTKGKNDSLEKRRKQIWQLFNKYASLVSDKDELKQLMKTKFGIDLVFFGKKDNPYGYTIVDHQSKLVLKGSDVMKLSALLGKIKPLDERIRFANGFIQDELEKNPNVTTKEMNKYLKRHSGVAIKKGKLAVGDKTFDIDPRLVTVLRDNDRRSYLSAFDFNSREAQIFFSHLMKTELDDPILDDGVGERMKLSLSVLEAASQCDFPLEFKEKLEEVDLKLFEQDGKLFAVNFNEKQVIDLEKESMNVTEMIEKVKLSHRVGWVQNFCPSNEYEKDFLASLFKIDPDWLRVPEGEVKDEKKKAFIEELRRLGEQKPDDVRQFLEDTNTKVVSHDGRWYAFNFEDQTCVNLESEGINTSPFQQASPSQQQGVDSLSHAAVGILKTIVGTALALGSGHVGAGGGGGQTKGKKRDRDWKIGDFDNYLSV